MRININTIKFSCQIQNMFSAIAPRYDFLNRLLSIGQDKYWRKFAVDTLAPKPNETILDIATGTCDILLEIVSRGTAIRLLGVDFNWEMLSLGQSKILKSKYKQPISLLIGDGECLPVASKSFNGIICAFGIRNFSDIKMGLMEFYRLLKPGGRIVILEFTMPSNPILKYIYNIYFYLILPKVGNFFSKHSNAYNYLPKSVANFPNKNKFVSLINEAGFKNIDIQILSFGIVSVYQADKIIS